MCCRPVSHHHKHFPLEQFVHTMHMPLKFGFSHSFFGGWPGIACILNFMYDSINLVQLVGTDVISFAAN